MNIQIMDVLVVGYVLISTYYLIGILNCYSNILKSDRSYKMFLKKCPPASIFALFLIIIASYSWPVMLPVQYVIKKKAVEVERNIKHS